MCGDINTTTELVKSEIDLNILITITIPFYATTEELKKFNKIVATCSIKKLLGEWAKEHVSVVVVNPIQEIRQCVL